MYKVTHAFDYSIVYYTGTEEECALWMGAHLNEHSFMALLPIDKTMETTRRRVRRGRVDYYSLSPEQQVSYVIEHWDDEIWTPVNAEVEFGMSIDSCEYRDYYFIPGILEKVEGTEYEKYIPEICHGYLAFELDF